MNDQQKETYIAWLNDAHAMEEALIKVLEKQVEETKSQPEMQARLKQHLDETKQHAELMKGCIERNEGSVSGAKDFMGKTLAAINGAGVSMAEDAMVKNVHISYAAEHFEIGAYTLISAAAAELGDADTVVVCDGILADEIAMADWLLEQLPEVTVTHLSEQA